MAKPDVNDHRVFFGTLNVVHAPRHGGGPDRPERESAQDRVGGSVDDRRRRFLRRAPVLRVAGQAQNEADYESREKRPEVLIHGSSKHIGE